MVEITFRPPVAILIVAIAIFVLGMVGVFLKKSDLSRRLIGLAVVIAVAAGLLIFLYRPTTVAVDATGVVATGPNRMAVEWEDVRNAYDVPVLSNSPYRPTVRTRGVAIGEYRSGRFLLSNGDPAWVLAERSDRAVVLVTGDLTYLIAPRDIEQLVDAVNTFRTIAPPER